MPDNYTQNSVVMFMSYYDVINSREDTEAFSTHRLPYSWHSGSPTVGHTIQATIGDPLLPKAVIITEPQVLVEAGNGYYGSAKTGVSSLTLDNSSGLFDKFTILEDYNKEASGIVGSPSKRLYPNTRIVTIWVGYPGRGGGPPDFTSDYTKVFSGYVEEIRGTNAGKRLNVVCQDRLQKLNRSIVTETTAGSDNFVTNISLPRIYGSVYNVTANPTGSYPGLYSVGDHLAGNTYINHLTGTGDEYTEGPARGNYYDIRDVFAGGVRLYRNTTKRALSAGSGLSSVRVVVGRGCIRQFSIQLGGSGYSVGNIVGPTTSPYYEALHPDLLWNAKENALPKWRVTAVSGGAITAAQLIRPGVGYFVDDEISDNQPGGGFGAQFRVTEVTGEGDKGGIYSIGFPEFDTFNYSVGNIVTVTHNGSFDDVFGDSCVIRVTARATSNPPGFGAITEYEIYNAGSGYKLDQWLPVYLEDANSPRTLSDPQREYEELPHFTGELQLLTNNPGYKITANVIGRCDSESYDAEGETRLSGVLKKLVEDTALTPSATSIADLESYNVYTGGCGFVMPGDSTFLAEINRICKQNFLFFGYSAESEEAYFTPAYLTYSGGPGNVWTRTSTYKFPEDGLIDWSSCSIRLLRPPQQVRRCAVKNWTPMNNDEIVPSVRFNQHPLNSLDGRDTIAWGDFLGNQYKFASLRTVDTDIYPYPETGEDYDGGSASLYTYQNSWVFLATAELMTEIWEIKFSAVFYDNSINTCRLGDVIEIDEDYINYDRIYKGQSDRVGPIKGLVSRVKSNLVTREVEISIIVAGANLTG